MADCKHDNFQGNIKVNKIEDIGRFMADVSIRCGDCKTPFRFLGLHAGLDYESPTIQIDAQLAHLPIAPQGEIVPPLHGLRGYSVRVKKVKDE